MSTYGIDTPERLQLIFIVYREGYLQNTWSFCICHISIGRGWGFDVEGHYPVRARGCRGWRRIEVEVTSRLAGQSIKGIRIRPAMRRGLVGVRNVQICRIVE